MHRRAPSLSLNPVPKPLIDSCRPNPIPRNLSLCSATMAAIAARTMMRSATSSARTAAARVVSGAKTKTHASPFRIPTQKPLSARIFRSPVEISAVSVHTMLPYHTATASALLTSMLSVAPRSYGWTLEVPPISLDTITQLLKELFCLIVCDSEVLLEFVKTKQLDLCSQHKSSLLFQNAKARLYGIKEKAKQLET
ncbi:hypothetical protein M9H77_25946 [Catharanthus roseus]|uniref:Uncharacterized protein n=1 Tax=Catharanthus roseus TaxID=4058 RepID=A0ACC0AAX7_CATRO|nr:hypothetical protein M9H77_25946 [Catharanthus roseus]